MEKVNIKEVEHLAMCSQRGLLLDGQSQHRLTRLLAGQLGEDEVVNILEQKLPDGWLILRNVWLLIDGNRTEVDILVIAPKFWWVIEVKNYEGKFEYRDQFCYLNQKQIPDQLAAYRNRIRIVKNIVKKLVRYTPEVYGSIIFINERCQVNAEDMPDAHLVMRYQLLWHIDEMLERHHQLNRYTIVEESLDLLKSYQTAHPFPPKILNADDFLQLKKGFCCPNCYKIDCYAVHRQIVCNNCQHAISKSEAVLRAACELGALFYTEAKIITTTKVAEFIGGAVHARTIRDILKANLTSYGKNNGTCYHNYGVPYENIVFPSRINSKDS